MADRRRVWVIQKEMAGEWVPLSVYLTKKDAADKELVVSCNLSSIRGATRVKKYVPAVYAVTAEDRPLYVVEYSPGIDGTGKYKWNPSNVAAMRQMDAHILLPSELKKYPEGYNVRVTPYREERK